MSELNGSPGTEPKGQAEGNPPAGVANPPAPPGTDGQAKAQGSAGTGQAPSTLAEDTFFDPSKLPEELKATYKQMQAAYTKKTMALAAQRPKIEAYDQFMRDPVASLQQMATQYGFSLTKGEARAMLNQQEQTPAKNQQQQTPQDWQPQSWQEVVDRIRQEALESVRAEFQPFVNQVQKVHAGNIEAQLSKIDPQWKLYEDEMRSNLSRHPTLVEDVAMLYRLSVPEEVYTSRAVQAAIRKMEEKGQAAKMGGKTETSKATPALRKAKTFEEAYEIAKEQLAQRR